MSEDKTDKTDKKPTAEDYADTPGGPFKKGNPGKPKGATHFHKDFERAVRVIAKEKGKTTKEIIDMFWTLGFGKAMQGDYSFWKDIADRKYGKPMQPTDITTGGEPIKNTVVKFIDFDGTERQQEV